MRCNEFFFRPIQCPLALIGAAVLFCVVRGTAAGLSGFQSGAVCDVEDLTPPTGVSQLIYSSQHGMLILKNAASAIATIDLSSGATTLHLANAFFSDMTISPSGRYVFAADYGGETNGGGHPLTTSFVHRLDLQSMTWETKTAFIAGNVQAVSDTQVILKSLDSVSFTNDVWGAGAGVVPVNTPFGISVRPAGGIQALMQATSGFCPAAAACCTAAPTTTPARSGRSG